MASALSVDAQEFVPGNGIVGSKQKPELCRASSLSVDAPVFVPVITAENGKYNSSSTNIGKQENKSSIGQRRGRFAHIDSRAAQPNQKNVDISVKTSTRIKKENNGGKTLKVQPSSNHSENKSTPTSMENADKKKLKQSFSLEYSKRRKHATSRDLEQKETRDSDGDTQMNYAPPNIALSSGESKPIILWSSIVKQEPNNDKGEVGSINQKTGAKSNTVPDEKSSPKKYSKNKVTRTKNVLSEPHNDRYLQRAEWKRRDLKEKDEETKVINKPFSAEYTKILTETEELLSPKAENSLLTEVSICNVTNTGNLSSVVKNLKRRNKEKVVKSGMNVDVEKSLYNDFNCESEYSKGFDQNELPNKKPQKVNNSKGNLGKVQDEHIGDKVNLRNNTIKMPNNQEKCLNIEANALKTGKLLKQSQNINNNVIPDEKQETLNLNLSDNSNFPALSMGSMPTTIQPFSYSDVTKRIIPLNKNAVTCNENKNMLNSTSIQLSEEEKRALKKRQNALKRKQKKQAAKTGKAKKEVVDKTLEKASEKEITFDLSDMFTKLLRMPPVEKKSQKSAKSKKLKVSTGVISVVSGLAKKNTPDGRRLEKNKYGTTHTIMDGTTVRKRGKERETPKKKRPTLLKKVITAERERKREMLENNSSGVDLTKETPLPEGNITDNENTNMIKIEHISEFPEDIWKKLHSKKFREYCDHVLTKEINNLTYNLLVTLQKFQDRVYHENPIKYKQKRRYILGLREVLKHLKLKRLKAVIIAPNIERISSKGGLDDYLGSIISICNELKIPKIFAMNRHVLGRVIKKLAPVSVVGIFDYDGAHEIFKELINHVQLAKVAYMEKVNGLNEGSTDISASSQEPVTSVFQDSMDNEQQIRNTNEGDQVKQHILNKLYVDEYRSYDAESESDAWVTDTESAPS